MANKKTLKRLATSDCLPPAHKKVVIENMQKMATISKDIVTSNQRKIFACETTILKLNKDIKKTTTVFGKRIASINTKLTRQTRRLNTANNSITKLNLEIKHQSSTIQSQAVTIKEQAQTITELKAQIKIHAAKLQEFTRKFEEIEQNRSQAVVDNENSSKKTNVEGEREQSEAENQETDHENEYYEASQSSDDENPTTNVNRSRNDENRTNNESCDDDENRTNNESCDDDALVPDGNLNYCLHCGKTDIEFVCVHCANSCMIKEKANIIKNIQKYKSKTFKKSDATDR